MDKKKIKKALIKLALLVKTKKVVPIITPVDKNKQLAGKVALITGGSGGIGFAIAKRFYEDGANVIIAARNKNKLQKSADSINDSEHFKILQLDITDVKSLPNKVEEAAQLFNGRIDILVNAAGVMNKHDFFSTTYDEYDTIMNINAKGLYFLCQAVGKLMISKKIRGHILNITSSSAIRPAWTPYQMSKWAVRGFTQGLADLLIPYGVVVNAVAPGPTATEMLGADQNETISSPASPIHRMAVPEEIANVAEMLVNSTGDLIVGDTVYVTGGSGITTLHN